MDDTRKAALRLLVKIVLIAGVFWVVFTFVLGIFVNRGLEMQPALLDGDLVITYKLERYQVGDVVAYKNPQSGRKELSRIAAIGEHSVQLSGSGEVVFDNGSMDEGGSSSPGPPGDGAIEYPYRMAEGSVFLLDDNRPEGVDSRVFGGVPMTELLGKVVYLFRRRGF